MSASAKEREQFLLQLAKALPDKPAPFVQHYGRLLLRHAATHARLAEESCNGHPIQGTCPPQGCDMKAYNERVSRLQDRWDARIEKREQQIERRIGEIAKELGLTADFSGDPRGYTVKLHLPTGAYNTWGGQESGYGVPQ